MLPLSYIFFLMMFFSHPAPFIPRLSRSFFPLENVGSGVITRSRRIVTNTATGMSISTIISVNVISTPDTQKGGAWPWSKRVEEEEEAAAVAVARGGERHRPNRGESRTAAMMTATTTTTITTPLTLATTATTSSSSSSTGYWKSHRLLPSGSSTTPRPGGLDSYKSGRARVHGSTGKEARGVLDIMHGRCRMAIDSRIPTMPGRDGGGGGRGVLVIPLPKGHLIIDHASPFRDRSTVPTLG